MTEQNELPIDPSIAEPTPRKKTMSDAAIAANRANAQKSTGPRTSAGKLKSAANGFCHGLYALTHFEGFCHDQNFALDLVTNIYEQFNPITPTEHILVNQLMHFQLRFLQTDHYYKHIMLRDPVDLIDNPPKGLTTVLRELNAFPGRIARIIKSIETEQASRAKRLRVAEEEFEFEPIQDQPYLPKIPDPEPQPEPIKDAENEPKSKYTPGQILFKLFCEQVLGNDPQYAHLMQRPPEPQKEPEQNEAK
ncbi:MAG: hypothetical protein ABIQ44_04350 [Chloroflexia bacterium]